MWGVSYFLGYGEGRFGEVEWNWRGGGVCRGVEIMVEGGAWMVREMEIMRWTHSKDMPSSWFL